MRVGEYPTLDDVSFDTQSLFMEYYPIVVGIEPGSRGSSPFEDHLIHGICGRDLGIDLEAIEEMSNRLEQIGQVVFADKYGSYRMT